MEYLYIGIMIIILGLSFLPWTKWLGSKPKTWKESYEIGWKSAMKAIEEGETSPQDLYDQCQGDDGWDNGWMDACLDQGATEN